MFLKVTSNVVAGHSLIRRLEGIVTELGLDRRDFVVFGSGPLLAHGIRRDICDLDVVARGRAWEKVRQRGEKAVALLNGAPMATFCDGKIQFSSGWISGTWNVDDLIDYADVIEGLRFARLDEVIRYKRMLDRPKDRRDVKLIMAALTARSEARCQPRFCANAVMN